MGKLITAKIDVTKIQKALLFSGQKGTYLDLTIWVNDEPDQFGNDVSIEQRTKQGESKIYLGNGKTYKWAGQSQSESHGYGQGGAMAKPEPTKEPPPNFGNKDDLPF